MSVLAQRSHALMLKLAVHYEVDIEDFLTSFEGLVLDQVGLIEFNEDEKKLLGNKKKLKAIKFLKIRTGLSLGDCLTVWKTWKESEMKGENNADQIY